MGEGTGLAEGTLTLWDLDGATAEATKQVRDDVVSDLVLGEPGEHGEQPKQHRFDFGRGTSGGKGPVSGQRAGPGHWEWGGAAVPTIHSFRTARAQGLHHSTTGHLIEQLHWGHCGESPGLLRAIAGPWALAGGVGLWAACLARLQAFA